MLQASSSAQVEVGCWCVYDGDTCNHKVA
jgi:hypothetical protein